MGLKYGFLHCLQNVFSTHATLGGFIFETTSDEVKE